METEIITAVIGAVATLAAALIGIWFGRRPPAEDPTMQERAARIDSIARPDVGYGDVYYPSAWYETDLYWGKVGCFAWICGYHSATLMWVYTNGWSLGQNACNHGRCQSDGLSYKCYTSSNRWISGGIINGETNRNTTAVSGGCLTPYNWLSGGYDHLCNSDGAYQLWQAKAGSKWTARGDQYSFTWDDRGNYACNCNNNNDCDGDWKVPNCPPSGP